MQIKILHGEGNNKCRISKDDIGKAQEGEKWIWIVKDVIENKSTTLNQEDISSNSLQLKGLFWLFNHLLVSHDNILYKKVQDKEGKHIFLPNLLKPLSINSFMSIWVT